MLSLYEYVPGNAQYDDLFKIVDDDVLVFEYDYKRIVDTLAKQWVAKPIGIACVEPCCETAGGNYAHDSFSHP
jgi:hypothetical protein